MGLNEFLISPLFDHVLLTKGLALFTIFLLAIRFLPDFARNLTLLLTSIAVIEILTSPFYTFGLVAFVGVLYYGLFWLQWSNKKQVWCSFIAAFLVLFYFLLMNLPLFRSPWTGSMVHQFGIAYTLIRLLSVVLDVGRGKPLPSDPLEFFVYTFFIPTFFLGPIERLDEFRQNLTAEKRIPLSWPHAGSQLIRIATAFLKGWVVVRFLQLDWTTYFQSPESLTYGQLLGGMYVQAIGFYLFVSAINDFTIACSTLAGYPLSENYNYPYFKRNLLEFWHSWHMTLVRFFKDYVYEPLGGNRYRAFLNYLIVFVAIAMWHATSQALLIWGLWHGVGLCLLRLWQRFWRKTEDQKRSTFIRILSTLITFHYVALGWLIFWGGYPRGIHLILRIVSGNQWHLFE